MSIISNQNLYPGINAHLNSLLQDESGGWQSFHSVHLVHLSEVLESLLPPQYYTRTEKSLQIGEVDIYQQTNKKHQTTSDITVFETGNHKDNYPGQVAAIPVDTLAITETLIGERDLMSVIVYEVIDGNFPGKAITRLELLSPANLPGGAHHKQYLIKRQQTLKSGLNLVEMDYLHENHSVIKNLPEYPQDDEAYPYTILVSDLRAGIKSGKAHIYGWHVDEPIPMINIPLSEEIQVTMDFNASYQHSFERSRFYQGIVDYAENPIHFEKYSPDDRQRLNTLLENIQAEYGQNQ